jgi:hypothetical protein
MPRLFFGNWVEPDWGSWTLFEEVGMLLAEMAPQVPIFISFLNAQTGQLFVLSGRSGREMTGKKM